MFRYPFFAVRKILGLNHFVHDAAFRDRKAEQVFFINFLCGDQSVLTDFIGMQGEVFTDGALVHPAVGEHKIIVGHKAGALKCFSRF